MRRDRAGCKPERRFGGHLQDIRSSMDRRREVSHQCGAISALSCGDQRGGSPEKSETVPVPAMPSGTAAALLDGTAQVA
ncbi:hypothetical protein GCM10011415_34010 [Salipiger pallidus]|uniref:Uncharacterized protein n=1 Tax=Salipiger pallidus TaxID=1775170 RepID=A0A8J2ZM30_9RHOB|nr:hypothetical protein GCM10011415_34010 [Salipiger pallidus]